VLLLGGFLLAGFLFLRGIAADLPQLPEDRAALAMRPGTEIYAATGERIFTFNQSREWVELKDITPAAIDALIATEDAAFYQHRGIDIRAILGALWSTARHGFGTRGGSTLTQQLVKRMFFSPQKTIQRKVAEILLALELEALYARTYPGQQTAPDGTTYPLYKDRLLELYLNTVFYGSNAYGIADAAAVYFGRLPSQLSLPQAALLMGIINAPTAYNPLQNPKRASRRLQHVLKRMHSVGFIDADTWRSSEKIQVGQIIDPQRPPRNPTPYWVEAIKAEVVQRWGPSLLRDAALRIHTTLDMRLQKQATQAVAWGVAELDQRMGFSPYEKAAPTERKNYVQAALVCLTPHNGQVKAMVGGRDIFISYFNRALTARRQPGSGFKPVAYLAALEAGQISPLTLFVDQRIPYQVNGRLWWPRNYNNQYLGVTTAAWALVQSANATAVQITQKVGPEQIVKMARRLGFAGTLHPYMSIALGTNEVTVLEMASAYGTLAAAGLRVEPTLVTRIVDAAGTEIFAHRPAIQQAVAPELAYQMVQLLSQAVDRGTGRRIRRLGFTLPAAGKTGTTNDNTDAWFTGFTPELTTSVWIGFDERKKHKLIGSDSLQIAGGSGAAPIWARFMKAAIQDTTPKPFRRPATIRLIEVDPLLGVETGSLPPAVSRPKEPIRFALRPQEKPNTPKAVLDFANTVENATLPPELVKYWNTLDTAEDKDKPGSH
jgi:penicillin-binding protein 1A